MHGGADFPPDALSRPRSEVELRQKVLQRDQRVSELKEALAAKTKAYDEARRRLQQSKSSEASAVGSGPSRGGGSRGRSPTGERATTTALKAGGSGTGSVKKRGATTTSKRSPSPPVAKDRDDGEARATPAASDEGWRLDRDQGLGLPYIADSLDDDLAEGDGHVMDDESWGERVASLRLQVAQKDAEVERLKG